MGVVSSKPNYSALPQTNASLQQADIAVLEAFAAEPNRALLLDKFVVGSKPHFELLCLLAEQTGYPAELTSQIDSYIKQQGNHANEVKRYMFRKALKTFKPEAADFSRGGDKELVDSLTSALSLCLHHSKASYPVQATDADGAETKEDESTALADFAVDADIAPFSVRTDGLQTDKIIKESIGDPKAEYLSFMGALHLHRFAQDHPAVRAAADASDAATHHYLSSIGGSIADIEGVDGMVRKLLGSSWVSKHSSQERIAQAFFPKLTLPALRRLKGWFTNWSATTEMTWLEEVVSRVAPPQHVDLSLDREAMRAYCEEVWALLDSVSATAKSANGMRICIAFHRVKLAYAAAHSWTDKSVQDALLTFLRVPVTGVVWELPWDRGFFAQLGHDTRNAFRIYDVASNAGLAVPSIARAEMERIVTDAMIAILGADSRSKPGSGLAPWSKYCNDSWLKALQALGRIYAGEDPMVWNKTLGEFGYTVGSASLEQLRDKTELRFDDANQTTFSPWDEVKVSFVCKGIPVVDVKLYEINSTAYYTDKLADVPTDIALDGLLPFESIPYDFRAAARAGWSPYTRHLVTLALPSISAASGIAKRGIFIVEIIGGGTSVRAIIRKGALRFVERLTIAGHALTVTDERNVPLPPARTAVLIGGKRYSPDPSRVGKLNAHEIIVPFAATRSSLPVILTLEGEEQVVDGAATVDASWSFSSLVPTWAHCTEWYSLEASMHVERETLIKDNYGAQLLVRPRLLLHGNLPCSLNALVDVELHLSSTDADGIASTKIFKPFPLSADGEAIATFAVPPGLRSLRAQLKASVEILANGSRSALSVEETVSLNGIDSTTQTRDMYLRKDVAHGYVLYVFGKTGEPVQTSLSIDFNHCLTSRTVSETVTTSPAGAAYLGSLDGFYSLQVRDNSTLQRASFDLVQDVATYPGVIHTTTAGDEGASDRASGAAAARAVQAAFPFRPTLTAGDPALRYKLSRRDVSLLEMRDAPNGLRPVADIFNSSSSRSNVSYDAASGFIVVYDLPAGTYQLTIKRPCPSASRLPPPIIIRVLPAAGATFFNGHIGYGSMLLQVPHDTRSTMGGGMLPSLPIQIASVRTEGEDLVIRVSGGEGGLGPCTSKSARVHIFGSFFVSPWFSGNKLARISYSNPGYRTYKLPETKYLLSRTLPEEVKYVLDRQLALASSEPPLPGNLLPRPSLLLNPWSLGTVESSVQTAAAGGEYARHANAAVMASNSGGVTRATNDGTCDQHNAFMSFDFLTRPAVALSNLRLSSSGEVRIPLATFATAGSDRAAHWDLCVSIVACDISSTAATMLPLSLPPIKSVPVGQAFRDLTRTGSFLPLDSHAVHASKVATLTSLNEALTINSAGTFVKVEAYSSIDKVFSLFASLSGNPALKEWVWLLQWPTLSVNEKCSRYSKHACHELHLWIYFKDQAFFNEFVRPFLLCKRAKQFVDHWLLGDDMRAYAQPQFFDSLNALEKALLAAALPQEMASNASHHLLDYIVASPTTSGQRDAIFKSALASDGLSATSMPVMMQTSPAPCLPTAASFDVFGSSLPGSPPPPCPPPMMSMMAMRGPAPSAPSAPVPSRSVGMRKAKRNIYKDKGSCDEENECDGSLLVAESAYCDEVAMAACEEMAVDDFARREQIRDAPVFRPLDKTEEYAEAQYFKVKEEQRGANLIAINEFWADFAVYCASLAGRIPAGDAERTQQLLKAHPFVSANIGVVGSNTQGSIAHLNEMLAALAVLSLPFDASASCPPSRPDVSVVDGGAKIRYTCTGTPLIVFHQDLSPVPAVEATTVLCGQNYFDPNDRAITEKGVRRDKYLPTKCALKTGEPAVEMVAGKVYGCMVVVTNISSLHQQLEVLLKIPDGAMPASNGFFSRTELLDLPAFATKKLEYLFYFPRTGGYGHYPVHVGDAGELLAHASPSYIRVTSKPRADRDTQSWQFVSVYGTPEELFAFLKGANLASLDLSRALWRCADAVAYRQLVELFRSRCLFFPELWAYAFKHGDVQGMKEYLHRPEALQRLRADSLLGANACGFACSLFEIASEDGVGEIVTDIADVHPVLREYNDHVYEHLEYSPLVNARAHILGKKRAIMNNAVERQFRRLLVQLCLKPYDRIGAPDLLAVTYHLLLQDRVTEAMQVFRKVQMPSNSVLAKDSGAARSRNWLTIQYDYMAAYLDFFNCHTRGDSAGPTTAAQGYNFPVATAVAEGYQHYPVSKWGAKFRELADQIAEARSNSAVRDTPAAAIGSGKSNEETETSKELSREAQQSKAAAVEPSLTLSMEGADIILSYANMSEATLRLYSMDVELLFSTEPFFSSSSRGSGDNLGKFGYVRPNGVFPIKLPTVASGKVSECRVPLPPAFVGTNAMVEVISTTAHIRKTVPYFSNKLAVTVTEAFGRLRVCASETGAPVPRAYVKVYHKSSASGSGKFYKDGYTDVRGSFDYHSLSSGAAATGAAGAGQRFALLVVSDRHGSFITTAACPR